MKRLDHRLVELGLAPTRSKAQQLISAGEVELQTATGWRTILQASHNVEKAGDIRIKAEAQTLKYVSRGGLKLEAALHHLNLNPQGWRCLDIGLSTGGFADCLLQAGAAEVAGVDVGHGQLAARLQTEPRLKSWEGLHVREVATHGELRRWISQGIQLCVVDVSFISLLQVLPILSEVLPTGCRLLALVKPQFEVGPEGLNRRGVVSSQKLFAQVEERILHAFAKYGFSSQDYTPCAVKGQDGNQEFFGYALRDR